MSAHASCMLAAPTPVVQLNCPRHCSSTQMHVLPSVQQDTAKAEVLELVVTFTNDCTLLAKATILSSYYREIALSAVKQRLPCLLVHAVKRAAEDSLDQTDEEVGGVGWCLCV